MKKLTFLTDDINIDAIPYPAPASDFMPDWYKNMPSKANKEKRSNIFNASMKVCPGIHDIMRAGYIIPAWCDFYLDLTKHEAKFESSNGERFYSVMPQVANKNFPFPKGHETLFFKFRTPWRIESNSELSVLVTSPKYKFDLPYQMYEGVMDINPYIAELNFIISVPRGGYVEFKRGDPLIQIIPFATNSFTHTVKAIDNSMLTRINRQAQYFKSFAFGGFLKSLYRRKTFE